MTAQRLVDFESQVFCLGFADLAPSVKIDQFVPALSSLGLNPNTRNPKTLNPKTLNPKTQTPKALNPKTLKP